MRAAWARAVGSWWTGALVAGAMALGCASAMAGDTPAPRQILGVRFGGDRAAVRVVIDVDGPLSVKPLAGEGGARRIVLGLPRIEAPSGFGGPGQGLVKAWTLQSVAPGVRLTLDLAADGEVRQGFLIPPGQGVTHYRYVIDIAASSPARAEIADAADFAARPVKLARHTPMVADAAPIQSRRARKVIVVDAGHGGHDPGAQSPTRNEKDITLAAAQALRARLERMGRYKVVLTRDSDVFVPLETRVRIARRAGADLFISLHADSAGGDAGTHGASVYTLSDSGQTRVNYVLGPHEWFTHVGPRRDDPAVSQILLDLTQNSTRNRSATFAGLLIEHIGDRVDLLPRSHRDAGYFVLLAPDVPAALLEMGFITNPADEERLSDPTQRDRLMDGVAEAIDDYFGGPTRLAVR